MEQKRILWIAASVGVFLLVVIGAALILYSPPRSDASLTQSALQDTTWMRPPEVQTGTSQTSDSPQQTGQAAQTASPELPGVSSGTQTAVAQTTGNTLMTSRDGVTVITDKTNVYSTGGTQTIDLGGFSGTQTGAATTPSPSQPQVEPVTQPPVSQAAPSVTAPAKPPAAVVSNVPPAPPAASAPKPPATPAASPAVPVSVKKPLADQFWVQAAAYKSKKNADNAREALTANKLPCEVFTYTDKGELYYRVRVGPYTTESEAKYWQTRIAQITEFSDVPSYVTNATAKAQ